MGRELRMAELKERIETLEKELAGKGPNRFLLLI